MKNFICEKCSLFLKHKNLFLYSLNGIKNRHHLYKVCPALELKISNEQYEKYERFIQENNMINKIYVHDEYKEDERNQFKQKMIQYHFFDDIEEDDINKNCLLYPEWMIYFLSKK